MSAANFPPQIGSEVMNYLTSLDQNSTEVKEAIGKLNNAIHLQTEISQIWDKVLSKNKPITPDELKKLNSDLHAKEFSKAITELDESLNAVFQKHANVIDEDVQKTNHEVFGGPGFSLCSQLKDFHLASENTLLWGKKEAELEKAKEQYLKGNKSPNLHQEVEALNTNMSHNNPIREYWYNSLVSKEFKKHVVPGGGSCGLRAFYKITKDDVQHERNQMLDYIEKNWNHYGQIFLNPTNQAAGYKFNDFEGYKAIMQKPETHLRDEELQVLSDMTGKTVKIYSSGTPIEENGHLKPIEISPDARVSKAPLGTEVFLYHDPIILHYDALVKKPQT